CAEKGKRFDPISTCASFTWSLGSSWMGLFVPGRYTLEAPAKVIENGGPVWNVWPNISSQPPSTAFLQPPPFIQRRPLPTGISYVIVLTQRWDMSKPARPFSRLRLYQVRPLAPPSLSELSSVFDHVQNELMVVPFE